MAREQHPFRIGAPALASLAVNAMLLAGLLTIGVGPLREDRRAPALTVVPLAATKGVEDGKEEAEVAEKTAAIEAREQDSAPPLHPSLPPPPLVLEPLPAVQPAPVAMVAAPVIAPAASERASAAAAARPAEAPAQAVQPAATARKGAADGFDVRAPSGTGRGYLSRVRSWLYAHKLYPREARMRRLNGVVRVRFVLDRHGVVLDGEIVKGSGVRAFDTEVMAMLQRASPFPAPPAEVPGQRIEFVLPVDFTLDA